MLFKTIYNVKLRREMHWLCPQTLRSTVTGAYSEGVKLAVRKTKKMLDVERRLRRPLERAIPEMLNEEGFTETAKLLKLSKATLNYWMLKLGIEVRRVALAPGEEIEIKRSTG